MYAFAAPGLVGARALSGASLSTNTTPVRATTVMAIKDPSPAMPFLSKPANLDASMPGYAGFGTFYIFNLRQDSGCAIGSGVRLP